MSTTSPMHYNVYRRTKGKAPLTIALATEQTPSGLAPDEVLLRVHTVSLNYRDVGILTGKYPAEVEDGGIPCSDYAAEVVSTGSSVTGFAVGDRVTQVFDLNNLTWDEDLPPRALGGDVPGVLREYNVSRERYLVKLPDHLSWEEGCLLSCAGATAWVALNCPTRTPNDQASALLQGTGGVSMFALLICLSAGIRPIITSSSDDKLAKIRSLDSRVAGINYKRQSILEEVQRLTDSRGVDFVINNTGPASIPEDLNCLRQKNGTVSMVGFLDGFGAEWAGSTVMKVLLKRARIQGYGIGSKADLESLVQFLDEKKVRLYTIIDRVFPFAETMVAFEYMASGSHTGKVVIRIG